MPEKTNGVSILNLFKKVRRKTESIVELIVYDKQPRYFSNVHRRLKYEPLVGFDNSCRRRNETSLNKVFILSEYLKL